MLLSLQRLTRSIWQRLPVRLKIRAARAIQPKFTVSATAVIVNEAGEVLLLEHVLRPGSGWALPGGFLNSNEKPEDALRREMREEVSLGLEQVKPYAAQTNRSHVEIFFLARPVGEPVVRSREIIGFKWFSADMLPPDMSRGQQQLIKEVLQAGFD